MGRDSGKQKKENMKALSPEQEAGLKQKAEEISKGLQSYTWRDLETGGKFTHNDKLTFIRDDMLIVGCDIGSERHYARAIDAKGRELSKGAYSFENSAEGFQSAKDWALCLAAQHGKNQIVLGVEPTGHYWFSLAAWMIAKGISVVQVNPYAVKQTKELADNSQAKNDAKDPKLIAELVKNGNYGVPYLPEDVYAELRVLCTLRDQLMEDRVRNMNRLHREMKIVFPEYREAFGKIDGIFTLSVLANAPLPSELVALGEDGVKDIWHAEKLRGGGYKRAKEIVRLAGVSAGLTQGSDVERRNEHQCDRYRPLFHAGKRGQQYERKHHAAGAEQLYMREKDTVHDPRGQRCRQDHEQNIGRSILFLQQRSHDQQHHDISDKMFPARMSDYMPKQTHIRQRGQHRRAVHAEQCVCRPPLRDPPQRQ